LSYDTLPLLSAEKIEELLSSRFEDGFLKLSDLPDPYMFKDMQKAADRIVSALNRREKIVLVGDYDVDGVCSTAIMRLFFRELGYDLDWVIPNRFRDGYGFSPSLLSRIADADLIITVDNGISSLEAASECERRGIDLIITDHHIVPKIPPAAYAIVNQKQQDCTFPYDEVCGAQIAWYLCAALKRSLGVDIDMKSMLQIATLAVIADIMPLLHINRAIVKSGLSILQSSDMPFIKAYREYSSKERLRAEDIAFGLAPVINSAGRVEDASIACEYICAQNIYDARNYLKRLVECNERRKLLEESITAEAMELAKEDEAIQVIASDSWHEGVIGIVASRVARAFETPAIILTANGEDYKGSGRSFGECNLFDMVSSCSDRLKKFGGHKAAIGLSLEKKDLDSFTQAIRRHAKENCDNRDYIDPDILGELPLSSIDWNLYAILDSFEPYGEKNRKPKFLARDVYIREKRYMSDGRHLKFIARNGDIFIEILKFRLSESEIEKIENSEKIDIIYTVSENIFNDRRTLQLIVEKIL